MNNKSNSCRCFQELSNEVNRASKKMSVKFPDNDDDFNNEFDAAVKGGYKHIFARSIFEPYLFY